MHRRVTPLHREDAPRAATRRARLDAKPLSRRALAIEAGEVPRLHCSADARRFTSLPSLPFVMPHSARLRLLVPMLALAMATACSGDATTAPTASAELVTEPSRLFEVDSGSFRILADYYSGANHIMEFELGAALLNGREYQGSAYIRVSVPPIPTPIPSSMPCITSTLLKTEVRPGWKATVRKAGGCDKDIVIDFANNAKQRATFTWRYVFGLSKVDHGAVR